LRLRPAGQGGRGNQELGSWTDTAEGWAQRQKRSGSSEKNRDGIGKELAWRIEGRSCSKDIIEAQEKTPHVKSCVWRSGGTFILLAIVFETQAARRMAVGHSFSLS